MMIVLLQTWRRGLDQVQDSVAFKHCVITGALSGDLHAKSSGLFFRVKRSEHALFARARADIRPRDEIQFVHRLKSMMTTSPSPKPGALVAFMSKWLLPSGRPSTTHPIVTGVLSCQVDPPLNEYLYFHCLLREPFTYSSIEDVGLSEYPAISFSNLPCSEIYVRPDLIVDHLSKNATLVTGTPSIAGFPGMLGAPK